MSSAFENKGPFYECDHSPVPELWTRGVFDPKLIPPHLLNAAGGEYLNGIDLSAMVQVLRDCAEFQGLPFDADGAESKCRYLVGQELLSFEDAVFGDWNEDWRQRTVEWHNGAASFEQLNWLANKAVSAHQAVVADHRQMITFFFQEDGEDETRDHVMRRDALLVWNVLSAVMRWLLVRDTQTHSYFRDTYQTEEEKQFLYWHLKQHMWWTINDALKAQQKIIGYFKEETDGIEAARQERMEQLVDGMYDLANSMTKDDRMATD